MARVLVIDPDRDARRRLVRELRLDGQEAESAGTVMSSVKSARLNPPDLILLDWKLPDGGAEDLLTSLERRLNTRSAHLIFVTARRAEADRIRGFELGAADYVVEPYSMRELLLRIRAVLRRSKIRQLAERVERGHLRVDLTAHRAWVDGHEVELARLELKLLVALIQREGRVCSREALLNSVWGEDVSVVDRTVDVTVARLRRKLGRAAVYLQSVRSVGYRFCLPEPK